MNFRKVKSGGPILHRLSKSAFLLLYSAFALFALLFGLPSRATPNRCILAHLPELRIPRTARLHPPVTLRGAPGYILEASTQNAILRQFDELASLVGSNKEIQLPEGFVVEVGPISDMATHDTKLIRIPVSFRSVEYAKHPKITRVVLAHEWGHELLLVHWLETHKSSDGSVFQAYTELFADTVPVTWLKDGRITREPLYSAALSKTENQDALMRDFTARHRVANWSYEGRYAILAPTRSWLWAHYLKRPEVQARTADALDALIDAIGLRLVHRFNTPMETLTPQQLNENFMSEITKQLARRGIVTFSQ